MPADGLTREKPNEPPMRRPIFELCSPRGERGAPRIAGEGSSILCCAGSIRRHRERIATVREAPPRCLQPGSPCSSSRARSAASFSPILISMPRGAGWYQRWGGTSSGNQLAPAA